MYSKRLMKDTTLQSGQPNLDLIQRAQKGDRESIGWLFERYQPAIFRYLYYRLGDQQAADDLCSEVFLRMLRSLPAYQDRQTASFQSWLFRIARNLVVDYFRQNKPNQELQENIPDSEPQPEAAFEKNLTHAALQLGLAQLSSEQSDVIILRFILEMPIAQVALVLGKSEDAVKGLQRRSLLALRENMSK